MTASSLTLDHSGTLSHPLTLVRFAIVFILLCGLLYPLSTSLLCKALFPEEAMGSLIEVDGKVVGSSLVGQPFVSDQYFYGRPSAANYDPTSVGGSNFAPSNPALRQRVAESSELVQRREGVSAAQIPPELLAASGSGIDPHISPASATIQIERVAARRGAPRAEVEQLVTLHTQTPTLGVLGKHRVNVLELNLALDQQWPVR